MNGLLLTGDLFLSSQIIGQARQAGVQLQVATQVRDPGDAPWSVVVLDLELPGADPQAIASSPHVQGARLLAYGPHVNTAALQAATAAGFLTVPRSQMSASTTTLLRQLLSDSR